MIVSVMGRGFEPFTPPRCTARPVFLGRKGTIAAVHIEMEDPRCDPATTRPLWK